MVLHEELLNTLFNLGVKWMFKEQVAFCIQSTSHHALTHCSENGGGGNINILGKKVLPEAVNVISVCN